MSIEEFRQLLRSSIRYEFDDDRNFVITDYYTGKEIKLNLSLLDQEQLDELTVDEEDYESIEY